MKTPEQLREEFYKLANKKAWGACFECCDFERICKETADYWLSIIASRDAELLAWMRERENFYIEQGFYQPYSVAMSDIKDYLRANQTKE